MIAFHILITEGLDREDWLRIAGASCPEAKMIRHRGTLGEGRSLGYQSTLGGEATWHSFLDPDDILIHQPEIPADLVALGFSTLEVDSHGKMSKPGHGLRIYHRTFLEIILHYAPLVPNTIDEAFYLAAHPFMEELPVVGRLWRRHENQHHLGVSKDRRQEELGTFAEAIERDGLYQQLAELMFQVE